MLSLPKAHDVDLESANSNHGSGGVENTSAASDGGSPPSLPNADEIAGVVESNDDAKTKYHEKKESSASECSVEIVDLEAGPPESKLHFAKIERDCRICHLSMDATNHDSGVPIELGCSCKDDLAAAHKQCAEAWFKIKGNKTCEICGSIAQNISGITDADSTDQWNERSDGDAASTATVSALNSESRSFWHGHRFLNFLLACMVFAFVVSWLFHFNITS